VLCVCFVSRVSRGIRRDWDGAALFDVFFCVCKIVVLLFFFFFFSGEEWREGAALVRGEPMCDVCFLFVDVVKM